MERRLTQMSANVENNRRIPHPHVIEIIFDRQEPSICGGQLQSMFQFLPFAHCSNYGPISIPVVAFENANRSKIENAKIREKMGNERRLESFSFRYSFQGARTHNTQRIVLERRVVACIKRPRILDYGLPLWLPIQVGSNGLFQTEDLDFWNIFARKSGDYDPRLF